MNTWMNRQAARLDDMERYRETRSKLTDNNFAAINARMEPLANIPYRVAQTETAIRATNQRLDRRAETIVNSLDLIKKDVNVLSTRVEVLSNKIDAITPSRQSMLGQMPQAPPGPYPLKWEVHDSSKRLSYAC